MLRYYAAMPADKAYLMAGIACRDAKWPMMFVFLNRYLDISEAMEEDPDAETVDNSGFENTDVPEELPMPHVLVQGAGQKKLLQYLPDDKRDDLRSWILQNISTGGAASASSRGLAVRTCDCGAEIYEASLWCHSCKSQSLPCIVTGYPVSSQTRVACRSCGKPANKDDWNKFVGETKLCPWCGDAQTPFW
jgi:intraflagellar transport protein 172